jgi:hypothetical protein
MRLISWILQSGSEQFIYNWKTGKKNTDLDQGNWRQHNGMDKRNPGIEIYSIYREGIKVVLRQHANCTVGSVPTPRKSC